MQIQLVSDGKCEDIGRRRTGTCRPESSSAEETMTAGKYQRPDC